MGYLLYILCVKYCFGKKHFIIKMKFKKILQKGYSLYALYKLFLLKEETFEFDLLLPIT